MGNKICACTNRSPEKKGLESNSNIKIEVISKPLSSTPYENNPSKNVFYIESPATVDDRMETVEYPKQIAEYPITPQYEFDCQSEPEPQITSNKRPSLNFSLSLKDLDSVFTPNSNKSFLPHDYSCQIYETILKDFFKDNYPMSNEVINEMTKRNLLSSDDSSMLLGLINQKTKSEFFFSKFVFSEANICKLATFLFVLISEKSAVFYNLNQNEKVLHSIVNHIYYVINLICLLQEHVEEPENIKSLICNSSLINILYRTEEPSSHRKENNYLSRQFYIKVHFDNLTFPSVFWSNFSKINEDFLSCQEISISSCSLTAQDVYNLTQGLKSSSVLKVLDISTNPITDNGLKHIQALFQMKNCIEALNLTCCSLTHVGVEEFLEVLSHSSIKSHLKSLKLSHNELCDMAESSILILTKLPLTVLEIQSTNMRYQKSLFESLKLNYSLRHVDISKNKLFNKDLTYLASGLAYNNNIRSISMAMIGLCRNDCGTINNTFLMNKSLVSIDLSDNPFGDEGIEILKDILIMKKTLREISFKRCNISLHGVLTLLRQASEPDCHLKILDLCYNRCPRMSVAFDSKDVIRSISDIMHHIVLVKNIRILLWGTLDLSMPLSEHIHY